MGRPPHQKQTRVWRPVALRGPAQQRQRKLSLRGVLRASLEQHRETLERVHEEQKANAKVTETLLVQVAKDKSSGKGSGKGRDKWNWRPPRLCFGCQTKSYLGSGRGCANPQCITNTVDKPK